MGTFFTVSICCMVASLVISGVSCGRGHIAGTKIQDCSGRTCIEVCSFGRIRLLPGTEVNDSNSCQRIRCNQDYSIEITG